MKTSSDSDLLLQLHLGGQCPYYAVGGSEYGLWKEDGLTRHPLKYQGNFFEKERCVFTGWTSGCLCQQKEGALSQAVKSLIGLPKTSAVGVTHHRPRHGSGRFQETCRRNGEGSQRNSNEKSLTETPEPKGKTQRLRARAVDFKALGAPFPGFTRAASPQRPSRS